MKIKKRGIMLDNNFNQEEAKRLIRELKEVKEEWLETKPGRGGGQYLGNKTIIQILNNVALGWDFLVRKEWREEIYKYDKQSQGYVFDGYVYHVRGALTIPHLGTREQYGAKVAVGGKDNQDSAYKAAASNCMNKCASLFGIGESVYANIKVEMGEDKQYEQMQNNPEYVMQQEQQYQQQQYQQQQPMQYQQQPMQQQGMQQPMQQQYQQQGMQQQYQQQGNFNQPLQEQTEMMGTSLVMEQQPMQQYQQQFQTEMVDPFANIDPFALDQSIMVKEEDLPFNQSPVQNGYQADQPIMPIAVNMEANYVDAMPNQVDMTPNQVNVEAVSVDMTPTYSPEVNSNNPWGTSEIIQQMQIFESHKVRLGLAKSNDIIPHLRNYYKDENACMETVQPTDLVNLNNYLSTVTAY